MLKSCELDWLREGDGFQLIRWTSVPRWTNWHLLGASGSPGFQVRWICIRWLSQFSYSRSINVWMFRHIHVLQWYPSFLASRIDLWKMIFLWTGVKLKFYLLACLIPNWPWTGTSLWTRGWGPLMYITPTCKNPKGSMKVKYSKI